MATGYHTNAVNEPVRLTQGSGNKKKVLSMYTKMYNERSISGAISGAEEIEKTETRKTCILVMTTSTISVFSQGQKKSGIRRWPVEAALEARKIWAKDAVGIEGHYF
ncbi:MAG: hypothetical protein U5K51_16450 [Flavobacteriaceae bacterium]|nr:hypothetical protein [Flavobacteriaceae bacterium]